MLPVTLEIETKRPRVGAKERNSSGHERETSAFKAFVLCSIVKHVLEG